MSNETQCTEAYDAAQAAVAEQAMNWCAELKTGSPDEERWMEFEAWLAANASHESTFCKFEKEWERLESASLPGNREQNGDETADAHIARLFTWVYRDACVSSDARRWAMVGRLPGQLYPVGKAVVTNPQFVQKVWPESATSRPEAPVVFISHGASDDAAVRSIANQLRARSFEPWIDTEGIVGQRWTAVLENVLALCSFVLVILSSHGPALPKRTLQVLRAWQGRMRHRSRLIVVRLDECRVDDSLEHFPCVDLFAESDWPRLMARLRRDSVCRLSDYAIERAVRASTQAPSVEHGEVDAPRPALDRKLAIFPKAIEDFLVLHQLWGLLDVEERGFMARTSSRLEPIVNVHPGGAGLAVLGFQCLALGPNGENFTAIFNRCKRVGSDLLRICMAIVALETIARLREDAAFAWSERSRLKFLLHLDSSMLTSALLRPLLDRYLKVIGSEVVFEVNARTAEEHSLQLQQLNAELNIGFVAMDLHLWSNEARLALKSSLVLTKIGYAEFRALLCGWRTNKLESAARLRMAQSDGLPFIITGLHRPNRLRRVRQLDALCNQCNGETFVQGDAVDVKPRWSSKTPPLKVLGAAASGRALLRTPG